MKILKANSIILGGRDCKILTGGAIAFDKEILAVGDSRELKKCYANAEFTDLGDDIVAPAFINTHAHLEFSANSSSLIYGDFVKWLGSIVEKGGELAAKCTPKIMADALNSMLKSGVGAVGAVSSFGKDLEILAASPARVVFFNEILGSNPAVCEQNFAAFETRFKRSAELKSERFTPAVSPHSPYSLHPVLAAKALNFARERDLLVSTHFLESLHELEWLTSGTGAFSAHLKRFTPSPAPMYSPNAYLAMFAGLRTLFTHCVWADFTKLNFDPELHSVTHCAVSNRLLGARALDLSTVKSANLSLNIGTDGLSSNISLNFLDEMRAALMTHPNSDLNELAREIFIAATAGGARALNLNSGELAVGKFADIAVFKGFAGVNQSELITQLILQTKECERLYVGGKRVKF